MLNAQRVIVKFKLEEEGEIEFAVWDNPLESPKVINQDVVNFYKRFIRKGSVIIDIGAHTGDTTVPMALANGKEGTTIAFDPNPYVFEILSINSKLNTQKTNIIPYNYAIAVEPGEYFYNSSEATHNNGGISKDKINKHGKYQLQNKVVAVNLLDFLNKEKVDLSQLSFIKIDTEGLDYDILISFKEIIKNYRPIIIAECFSKLDKIKRDNLYTLFDELDFDLFKLPEKFETKEDICQIESKEDMRKWKHFDFYAVPKERVEEIRS